SRPSVDTHAPGLRVHVHKAAGQTTISLDLGGPLHRRGYRPSGVLAPLRETLAAAVVAISQAPRVLAEGRPLVDPFCGSGTLLVEAALASRDVAPGLLRCGGEPLEWRAHDEALWKRLVEEARERR